MMIQRLTFPLKPSNLSGYYQLSRTKYQKNSNSSFANHATISPSRLSISFLRYSFHASSNISDNLTQHKAPEESPPPSPPSFVKSIIAKIIPSSQLDYLLVCVCTLLGGWTLFNWLHIRDDQLLKQYLQNNNYDQAIIILEKKLKSQYTTGNAVQLLNCLRELKRDKEAEQLLLDMIEKLPEESQATRYQLAYILIEQERLQEAIVQLVEVVAVNKNVTAKNKSYVKQNIAREYNETQQINSEKQLTTATQKSQEYSTLGRLYYFLNQIEESEYLVRQAIQLDSGNIEAKIVLATILFIQDKVEEAKQELEKVQDNLLNNQKNVSQSSQDRSQDSLKLELEVNRLLLEVYLSKKELAKSLKLCRKDKLRSTADWRAECLSRVSVQSELKDQEKLIKEALDIQPNSLYARIFQADGLIKKGKYTEGLAISEETLKRYPESLRVIMQVAQIKSFIGMANDDAKMKNNYLKEAQEILSAATTNQQLFEQEDIKTQLTALKQLSNIQLQQKAQDEAIQTFEKILEIKEKDIEIIKQLVTLYANKEDQLSKSRYSYLQGQLSKLQS